MLQKSKKMIYKSISLFGGHNWLEPVTPACKAGALPTELCARMVTPRGIEPVTAVKGRCLNRLTKGPLLVAANGFELLTLRV